MPLALVSSGAARREVAVNQVGPYRLLSRLGAGGMGVAHLARDPAGRVVVVKVLRPEIAEDPAGRRRLAREVDTMRRVDSPYVARVLDADVLGDPPYLVAEYARGPSLREHVEEAGPLRGEALLRVARGLVEAVASIHAANIVHRDLTPGNVLLVDGRPVVIDFGIAWAVDATRLTMTGAIVGTPGYLAVEMLDGSQVGPPVDVFALAATLAFVAGGRPPFGTGPMQAVHYRMAMGKFDLRAVPAALADPLRAALAPDPAARPTVRQLGEWFGRLDPAALTGPASAPAGAGSAPAGAASVPAGPGAASGSAVPAGTTAPADSTAPAGRAPGDHATAGCSPPAGAPGDSTPPGRGAAGDHAAAGGSPTERATVGGRPVESGAPSALGVAALPVLVACLTVALLLLPPWVWAPWGVIAGSVFTWLRMSYAGPADARSVATRVGAEAVVAAGGATAATWGVALLVWLAGVLAA